MNDLVRSCPNKGVFSLLNGGGFVAGALILIAAASVSAQLAEKIVNTSGKYLVWNGYKIEVNQYGDLGRDWPTPTLVWEQYAQLKKEAQANPNHPNTLRTVLLILPNIDATAVKMEGGKEVVVGHKSARLDSDEVKWIIDQWREFEDMVYVYSGGNAWLRTDIKVIDEPIPVKTDENWGFFCGQHAELLDKYIPFRRGDYQAYNSIYCSKGLNAGPHGGTIGAVGGIKGCGTSDNAHYGPQYRPNRTGYVALHEWLNQQCSATSNMMPYPDGETLWNNYVLHKVGYREDTETDDWPWLSMRRDTMRFIIRPGMWRRWTAIDPYESLAIGRWLIFGPTQEGMAREMTTAPASQGQIMETEMERYTHFNMAHARPSSEEGVDVGAGTYYCRTYVESQEKKEVRLWAAADERFQVWLNGVMVRDGWGWNYSEDDGKLFEKVTYVTLEKGLNTLLLVLPNTDHIAEFRVRFCDVDGTGRQPEGVTTMTELPDGQIPVALATPVVHDFKNPKLYTWAEVNDNPWLELPRLDESGLRDLTGIASIEIITDGKPRQDKEGNEYTPVQHLFLRVPKDAVTSPWIAEPSEDNAALNNDFDWNWKSLGWLRVPGRSGAEKDILLLRFDVAEPLMHLLKTRGRPANESIVGWVLVEHKLAYVVLANLDVDTAPKTALGLLSKQPE
jgi:hypothetical protein